MKKYIVKWSTFPDLSKGDIVWSDNPDKSVEKACSTGYFKWYKGTADGTYELEPYPEPLTTPQREAIESVSRATERLKDAADGSMVVTTPELNAGLSEYCKQTYNPQTKQTYNLHNDQQPTPTPIEIIEQMKFEADIAKEFAELQSHINDAIWKANAIQRRFKDGDWILSKMVTKAVIQAQGQLEDIRDSVNF